MRTLHLRRRRRARWRDDPNAERSTIRDEHKDCWRDDFRHH